MLRAVSSVVLAFALAAAVDAQINRLAAIGDSLTDEYSEESYGSYARAWTQLLVDERAVTMGPTAADAGESGGWGEPRRSGYQDNWARFGATTSDALGTGQHTGVAEGVLNRGVDHLIVHIGGNDLSPWSGNYQDLYDGTLTPQQIDLFVDSTVASIEALLGPITDEPVNVVLASIVDFSVMPWVANAYPSATGRDLASAVFERLGHEIHQLANRKGYAFLDLRALTSEIFGANSALASSLDVGGVTIALRQTDNGVDAASGWVNDGIHPHTIVQGIWTNAYVAALNGIYGAGLTEFTEQELVSNAGLTYVADTLPLELTELDRYVFEPPFFYSGFENGLDGWSTSP